MLVSWCPQNSKNWYVFLCFDRLYICCGMQSMIHCLDTFKIILAGLFVEAVRKPYIMGHQFGLLLSFCLGLSGETMKVGEIICTVIL